MSMSCNLDRIDALLEGTLPEAERAPVLAHMEGCPACRAYYEALAGLEGEQTAPEGFTTRVMAEVHRTLQRKPQRPPYQRILAGLAACAVLVIGLSTIPLLQSKGSSDSAGAAAPEMLADAARSAEKQEHTDSAMDDAAAADDLPLTVHTLTDASVCGQVRLWLEQQNKAPLQGDNSPREAYDLTADEVKALNQAVPEADLPQKALQLELKSAK